MKAKSSEKLPYTAHNTKKQEINILPLRYSGKVLEPSFPNTLGGKCILVRGAHKSTDINNLSQQLMPDSNCNIYKRMLQLSCYKKTLIRNKLLLDKPPKYLFAS